MDTGPFYLYKRDGKFPDVTTRKLSDSELGDSLVFVSGPLDTKPNIDGQWFDANGNLTNAARGLEVPPLTVTMGQLADLVAGLAANPVTAPAVPASVKAWADAAKTSAGPAPLP